MKQVRISVALFSLILFLASPVGAVCLDLHGAIATEMNYFTEQNCWEGIREWGEINLRLSGGEPDFSQPSFFQFSADAILQEDRPQIKVREFYYKYSLGNWDLRLGKQLVNWSWNKGESPLDLVNPIDFADQALLDGYDQRLGVYGLNLLYYWNDRVVVEGIVVPKAPIARFASEGDWRPTDLISLLLHLEEMGIDWELKPWPRREQDSTEYGLRITSTIGRTDLGLIYYHGYRDTPIFRQVTEDTGLKLEGIYPAEDIWGFQTVHAVGAFLFSGEVAYRPEALCTDTRRIGEPGQTAIQRRSEFRWALETEYVWGDLRLIAGCFGAKASDNPKTLLGLAPTLGFLSRITYSLWDGTLQPAVEALYIKESDQSLIHPYLIFSPCDGWEIKAGLCEIGGAAPAGELGQYRANDYLYLKVIFYY